MQGIYLLLVICGLILVRDVLLLLVVAVKKQGLCWFGCAVTDFFCMVSFVEVGGVNGLFLQMCMWYVYFELWC